MQEVRIFDILTQNSSWTKQTSTWNVTHSQNNKQTNKQTITWHQRSSKAHVQNSLEFKPEAPSKAKLNPATSSVCKSAVKEAHDQAKATISMVTNVPACTVAEPTRQPADSNIKTLSLSLRRKKNFSSETADAITPVLLPLRWQQPLPEINSDKCSSNDIINHPSCSTRIITCASQQLADVCQRFTVAPSNNGPNHRLTNQSAIDYR